MKAIILAAGSDDQLGRISMGRPKCLVEIEGNSLLAIQINILHMCGIENITVVRGYEHKQIDIPGLNYYNNEKYDSTNVLHSLFCAKDEMDDELLILYSDVLFEEDVVKRLLESTQDITVGVMVNWQEVFQQRKTKIDSSNLEMAHFDAENRVRRIGKNLDGKYETQGQFTGMVKCSKHGVEILKKHYDRLENFYTDKPFGNAESFEKAWLSEMFNEMAELGVPLHCVIVERGWLDINTEEDYERAIKDTTFVRRLIKVETDWKSRAETYDRIDWVNRDETLDTMVDFAGDINGKKVLDIGVGTGKVLKRLKKGSNYTTFHGVDISPDMMSKISPDYGFNLSVMNIDDALDFKDKEFDVVTARMVFHHIENLDKATADIYRVLNENGKLIICEGNPPDRYSVKFYEEMFRYKENRNTFLLDDLTTLLYRNKFKNIFSKTIVLENMSLNNWLENAGVPYRNIDIIRRMHYECDSLVKKAYNMRITDDDIFMDWKFSVITCTK